MKVIKFFDTLLEVILSAMFVGVAITVPAAVIVWAIRWILTMVGVIAV